MGYEQIQQFIALPNLPDIITYVLYLVVLIVIAFVKIFVKKDNKNTIFKVDSKTSELIQAKKELLECKAELKEVQKQHKKEREEWQAEMVTIKQAIRLSSRNTKDLVSSGIANKISNMLPLEEDKDNIEVENIREESNESSN